MSEIISREVVREAKEDIDQIDNVDELAEIHEELNDNLAVLRDAQMDISEDDTYVRSSGAIGDVAFAASLAITASSHDIAHAANAIEDLKDYVFQRQDELQS